MKGCHAKQGGEQGTLRKPARQPLSRRPQRLATGQLRRSARVPLELWRQLRHPRRPLMPAPTQAPLRRLRLQRPAAGRRAMSTSTLPAQQLRPHTSLQPQLCPAQQLRHLPALAPWLPPLLLPLAAVYSRACMRRSLRAQQQLHQVCKSSAQTSMLAARF